MLDEAVRVTDRDSSWWSDCLARISTQREEKQFLTLYDHFAPRVATYLARLGASATVAEELTQETMLSVWRKAGLYDRKKAAASTWIFTVARNQYIDSIRRQTIQQESLETDEHEDHATQGPDALADANPDSAGARGIAADAIPGVVQILLRGDEPPRNLRRPQHTTGQCQIKY